MKTKKTNQSRFQILTVTVMSALIFTSVALAPLAHAEIAKKAPLRVNFALLIKQNNIQKRKLAKSLELLIANQTNQDTTVSDRQRVAEFIKTETHWNHSAQIAEQ